MKTYYLPINLNEINEIDKNNSIVDMSKLNFPCDISKQKRSSFIFIRNTNLDMNISFENCSYEDKSEFLLMYLLDNIEVDIPIITSTWMKILLYQSNYYDDKLNSIFNEDELLKFINENISFINEILNFVISIPLCAIIYYVKDKKYEDKIDISEFSSTDYDRINMDNFINLLSYEEFIYLIQGTDDMQPLFYNKYFQDANNPFMPIFLTKLPYLSLMNIMLDPNDEIREKFIDEIGNIIAGNITIEDIKEEN